MAEPVLLVVARCCCALPIRKTLPRLRRPMGFLEFRDLLFPASGFQSAQWRTVENMLGLRSSGRIQYGKAGYCSFLSPEDAEKVRTAEGDATLLDMLTMWLERTPFVAMEGFDFWEYYADAVRQHAALDRASIAANTSIDEAGKARLEDDVTEWLATFERMFDEAEYEKMVARGDRRLSYRAFKAAIFIELYAEEPILYGPARLLKLVRDVDELMTLWRHNHSLMVHRMLGAKMGTGGSSGFHYLKATTSRHRVFTDLFDIATYLVPDSYLPPLPAVVRKHLGYALESGHAEEAAAGGAEPAAAAAAEPAAKASDASASMAAGDGSAAVAAASASLASDE